MEAWLTPEIRQRIKTLFEPKYGRELSNAEIEEIAVNLTNFMENNMKFYRRLKYAGIPVEQ